MAKSSGSKNKNLPANTHKSNRTSVTATQQTFYHHQGPLPPAESLAQYEKVAPGSAERIIAMAEQQAVHRQVMEKKVIDSDIANSRRGLIYGLIIGLTAVVGGCACVMTGHDVSGSIIGGTGLTGLVGVFVYGSRERRKERETRLEAQIKKQ